MEKKIRGNSLRERTKRQKKKVGVVNVNKWKWIKNMWIWEESNEKRSEINDTWIQTLIRKPKVIKKWRKSVKYREKTI